MTDRIMFADDLTRQDFETMARRLEKSAKPEALIRVRGTQVLIFGCTQAPEGLLDDTKTVLVQRSFSATSAPEGLDRLVSTRSLLDRFARADRAPSGSLDVPVSSVTAAWAGVLPPKPGWEKVSEISAASLKNVAHDGIARVATLLPEDPGSAVVQKVRKSVWNLEIVAGVPAAAAFALEALGFLDGAEVVSLSTSKNWLRLHTNLGNVFVR